MSFPITGLGIVNALGSSADEVAASLRRGRSELQRTTIGSRSIFVGRVAAPLPDAPSRAHALLRHAAVELAPDIARARKRWGTRRVAIVLGCTREPAPLLELSASLIDARGPIYAVTTGALASAQAIASANALLATDLADAVAIGTVHVPDLDDPVFRDEPPRPLSRHSLGPAAGEGAAWLLLERQATADFELLHASDTADTTAADGVFVDANGDPQHDRDRLEAHRSRAPLVALAGYWGDLGPAQGLTAAVAAVLALDHGFIPASCLYDGHDPRIPVVVVDRDCDRIACTSAIGSTHVTLAIGARSS